MALLEVEDLVVEFRSDYGDVRASDRVCFTVDTGEVVGLVGESGSGKTVTSKAILRLVEPESAIRSGRIRSATAICSPFPRRPCATCAPPKSR